MLTLTSISFVLLTTISSVSANFIAAMCFEDDLVRSPFYS